MVRLDKSDILVVRLKKEHFGMLSEFQTSEHDLKDFLIDHAYGNQEMHLSNTWIFLHKARKELLGYISILADAIRIQGTHLEDYFTEKGISYKSLPALKIGRLCVDQRFERMGLGTMMVDFVMGMALRLNGDIALRYILLDSKRGSEKFYEKNGFTILKEKKQGHIPMYFDLKNIYGYLNIQSRTKNS